MTVPSREFNMKLGNTLIEPHFGDDKHFDAIVCFPGIFYRGGVEQKFRQYLVDNNYVETVISLAPNLFFDRKADTDHFAKSVDYQVVVDKDYNLSVSSYVEAKDNREVDEE